MMISAYSESYLDDAMASLGEMLEYAVNDCGFDADIFFEWFIQSELAERFGYGHPKYVAGMSGAELACEVVYITMKERITKEAAQYEDKSPAYWAGWCLAYYQWHTGLRFKDIVRAGLTSKRVMGMYILHEADMSKFVEEADKIMQEYVRSTPSRLQSVRKTRGLSQKALSVSSGVALRMVQLYEQRQSDINNASSTTVLRLSNALGCSPEEIMEPAF